MALYSEVVMYLGDIDIVIFEIERIHSCEVVFFRRDAVFQRLHRRLRSNRIDDASALRVGVVFLGSTSLLRRQSGADLATEDAMPHSAGRSSKPTR
jgi:hypothetical protein